jgi:uncharacterized protein (TIGR03663 family)
VNQQGARFVGPVRNWANRWAAACWLILVSAAVLRLYDLSLKPLHHDEGVNAYFFARLFRQGVYQYDPANYHGPTLYYFALLISSVIEIFSEPSKLSTVAIRLVPAFFGIATVALLLSLRKHVGDIGALVAATLLALSPGAVYFSRDFIHEGLLAFFALALPVAMLHYRDTRKSSYLMLASASAALMFATKETAAISAVVLVLALLLTHIYAGDRILVTADTQGSKAGSAMPLRRSQRLSHTLLLWLLAALVFSGLYALLYSSFFADPNGIHHSIETFRYWVRTGSQQHRAPWYTYLLWMEHAELPILVLGIVGTVVAMWRRRDGFALLAGLWAWGLLAAYSLLPYKTPWLMLNFIVPMAIVSGYAVQALWDWVQQFGRARRAQLMLASVAIILVASLMQSISLNFFRYDDGRLPYVYMQTSREFVSMIEQIDRIAARAGTGGRTTIMVTSRDYWPLPWYLQDYRYVGYPGRVVPIKERIIIASETQEHELIPLLADNYRRIGLYALRPGVNLVLYARNVSE